MRYSGSAHVDPAGSLVVETAAGTLREDPPVAFQEIGNLQVPVEAAFSIGPDGLVGFTIGVYDPQHILVIDPTLSFSTVVGGYGFTTINSLAVDANGSVYFAGCTDGTLSISPSGFQSRASGSNEAFIGKLGPDGRLRYASYLGGTSSDCATGIAVDSSGAAVVTGWTTSRNFPLVAANQGTLGGGRDAFVARVNAPGDRLVFSTYFGGSLNDSAAGVAVDSSGNIYVAGQTNSPDLPVRNAQYSRHAGGSDAFLVSFTSTGTLRYGTFYGGTADDAANAIAVSPDGVATIAGGTSSQDLTVAAAVQSKTGGNQDAFIAQFDAGGAGLRFATYLGGSGGTLGAPEMATGVALDATGAVYVTGVTTSTNFPIRKALYGTPRGGMDAFVTKLTAAGTQIVYSTYLGGASIDLAGGIAVDALGNAYVAGATWSPDFPAVNLLSARKSDYDAFVTRLDANGATLVFSLFLAGSAADAANTIALDLWRNIFIAGNTFSMDIPLVSSLGAPTGTSQGLIAEIPSDLPMPLSVSPMSGSGYRQQFMITSRTPGGPTSVGQTLVTFAGASGTASCNIVYQGPGTLSLLNNAGTASLGQINLGAASTLEDSQCRIYAATSAVVNGSTTQLLTLDIYFKPAFAGPKTASVRIDPVAEVSSASAVLGSWTATVDSSIAGPRQVSVAPASGSGYATTFVVTSSNSGGANDLLRTYVIWGSGASSPSCYVVFVAPNAIYLLNDNQTRLDGVILGSSYSVENSQCRLYAAHSSVTNAGILQTLTLSVYFKPAFAGSKTITVTNQTYTGQSNDTTVMGSWTVTVDPSAPRAQPESVSPSSGSGASGRFVVVSSDRDGASDLYRTFVTFSSPTSSSLCYLVYVAPYGIFLLNDALTQFDGVVPGSASSVENSQCRLNAAGSSVVSSGNTQTITLDLSFKTAFSGTKNITVLNQTKSDVFSDARILGTWTVPAASSALPSVASFSPASGSGSSGRFTLGSSDPNGVNNLVRTFVTFSSNSSAAMCYVVYVANGLYLLNDSMDNFGVVVPGSSTTAENSQCHLNGAGSSVVNSGNTQTITLDLSFKSAFAGAKNITVFHQTQSNQMSSPQLVGTWTVR